MFGILAAAAVAWLAGTAPDPAHLAYQNFVALAGTWHNESTKGWTEEATFTVVGKGSAVLEVSRFADTPDDAMATAVYLDRDRLLLTHYCEAKNQPRLVASEISPDGRAVTFTFLDATNLARPGAGHMHAVKYRFIDANHFVSQWTWYQDGKEQWMEQITHRRVR
jgi:hypothetical protein